AEGPPKTPTDPEINPGEMAGAVVPPVAPDLISDSPRSTPVPPAAATAQAGDPLAGYHFLECAARHPGAEVCKARDPPGPLRPAKIILGPDDLKGGAADGPLARLRRLRHAVLAPVEWLVRHGRLVGVGDVPEKTLADELKGRQRGGPAGLPRAELLGHL